MTRLCRLKWVVQFTYGQFFLMDFIFPLCLYNSYTEGQDGAVGSPTERWPFSKQRDIPPSRMRADKGDTLTGACGNLDSDLSFISQCGFI